MISKNEPKKRKAKAEHKARTKKLDHSDKKIQLLMKENEIQGKSTIRMLLLGEQI